jgi:hypothetical protein
MTRYRSAEVDAPEWLKASPKDPCPVCGATDGCKMCEDRTFACCMTVICEWPVLTGGWLHRLDVVEKLVVPA